MCDNKSICRESRLSGFGLGEGKDLLSFPPRKHLFIYQMSRALGFDKHKNNKVIKEKNYKNTTYLPVRFGN